MRGSRYGKYGELKRHERLKASRDAKRKLDRNSLKPKKKSGSMNQDPSLKIFFGTRPLKGKRLPVSAETLWSSMEWMETAVRSITAELAVRRKWLDKHDCILPY